MSLPEFCGDCGTVLNGGICPRCDFEPNAGGFCGTGLNESFFK